jgi:hypothetical protein
MIDDIDIIITNQQNAIEQDASSNRSPYQFDKTNQFKTDIIQQSIIISCQMGENFVKIVRDEQQRHSFNRNDDESQSEKQVSVINAIETRRLHMIKRVKYITQQKLATYFNTFGTMWPIGGPRYILTRNCIEKHFLLLFFLGSRLNIMCHLFCLQYFI